MSIDIQFCKDPQGYSLLDDKSQCMVRSWGEIADSCLNSRIFNVLTLGSLHTLVHELGHAVAHKMLTGGGTTIRLSTASCYGSATLHDGNREASPIGKTWIDLSGPLANIIFSVALIIAIFAITHCCSMSEDLSLGLKIAITATSAIWIIGEFFYAAQSASKKDYGDFGKIISRGWSHFLLSIALLIGICALCVFGMVSLD